MASKTKLGMNLLLWSNTGLHPELLPVLGRLADLGYDGVEVPILEDAPDLAAHAALGRHLDALGLQRTAVSVCNDANNPISPSAEIRNASINRFQNLAAACDAMGARLIVGPLYASLGRMSGKPPSADEWKWGVDSVRRMSEIAERFDVTIALEPLNRFEIYLLNTGVDGARFVKEVDHPRCTLMYDTFHAHIEEKSITQALTSVSPVLKHVHISENDRSTPGFGQVRWDETFTALETIGYDGWLTVEAFGTRLPELAAATNIWRRMFVDEITLAKDAISFLKDRTR